MVRAQWSNFGKMRRMYWSKRPKPGPEISVPEIPVSKMSAATSLKRKILVFEMSVSKLLVPKKSVTDKLIMKIC